MVFYITNPVEYEIYNDIINEIHSLRNLLEKDEFYESYILNTEERIKELFKMLRSVHLTFKVIMPLYFNKNKERNNKQK